MSGAADLEASEESIGLGSMVFGGSRERSDGQINIRPARAFLFPLRYSRLIAVAASIVIIVALAISYISVDRGEYPMLDQKHIVPIQEAMELASMNGYMVIPGGERSIDTVSEIYRSGYVRINDSLRTAFAYLAGEFQEDDISRGVLYWMLGGYIATGQVSAARDLSSQAIKEYPADIDLMIFDAIVSYMEGDIVASEARFRQVIEREPDNPYANLNLAVLLSERGEKLGALELLKSVVDKHGDSPFAARAKVIEKEILESSATDL